MTEIIGTNEPHAYKMTGDGWVHQPAECPTCRVVTCTCYWCDPNTTEPIRTCLATGKPAPMFPNPFRDEPEPHRFRPAWWTYLVGALLGAGIGIPLGLWIGGYL